MPHFRLSSLVFRPFKRYNKGIEVATCVYINPVELSTCCITVHSNPISLWRPPSGEAQAAVFMRAISDCLCLLPYFLSEAFLIAPPRPPD